MRLLIGFMLSASILIKSKMSKEITICLTSCGRFDLLSKSIESLIKFWDGPKPDGRNVALIINEDSGLPVPDNISEMLDHWTGGNFAFCFGDHNQVKAIDRIYERVESEYIFHTECDWEFTRTGFIQPSLDILESDPKILQVWIRNQNDRNGHPVIGMRHKTPNGTQYQKLSREYRKVWAGFSWNPGLRRKSDYDLVAPFSSYMTGNTLHTEAAIGQAYKKLGFYAATLLTGYVRHIGGNQSLSKQEIK